MNFLYPSFLWALAALSIPVIIHFFNFKRYKTVYFSNNRFLQAIQKKSQSFNRLKHWIVLLIRLLALGALILAFAQPFIPATESKTESQYAAVYVDNSLSMEAKGVQSSLLDEARDKTIQIIESLPQNFKVQIVTNNFDGKEQRYYSKQEAIQLIDEITPSFAFRSFKQVEKRIQSNWLNVEDESKGVLQVFYLSDFQKVQAPKLDFSSNQNWNISLLPLERANESNNIGIDSVWLEMPILQPGFDQDIIVRLKNYGNNKVENLSIDLEVNDRLVGASEFEINSASQKELRFNIRPEEIGSFTAKFKIESGEPYFDNTLYFTFTVKEPVKVLLIGDSNRELFEKLYQDSIYSLSFARLNQLNYGELKEYGLIILNEPNSFPSGLNNALKSHLEANRNLVLIPNLEDVKTTNNIIQNFGGSPLTNFVETEIGISKVYWDDLLFDNVFSDRPKNPQLPKVNRYFETSSNFPILGLENNSPVVKRVSYSNGEILVFGTDFGKESGSLSRHPIIVPIMLNMALYSQPNQTLYSLAGNNSGQQFKRENSTSETPLSILYQETVLIPNQREKSGITEIFDISSAMKPGNYSVLDGEVNIGHIAVNTDPKESEWEFWSPALLKDKSEQVENLKILNGDKDNISIQIKDSYSGYPLWRWFIIMVVVLLLIETLLLKLWK